MNYVLQKHILKSALSTEQQQNINITQLLALWDPQPMTYMITVASCALNIWPKWYVSWGEWFPGTTVSIWAKNHF